MEANSVTVRHLTLQDMTELRHASESVYLNKALATWNESTVKALLTKFPEGQICVVVDGIVVGCAFSLIIEYADFGDEHTYAEITSDMTFDNHDPKGDSLYGIEVFIHPSYRGLRLARRLYDARKELCENLNLRAIVAGGRMPNYAQYSDKISASSTLKKLKLKSYMIPY